MNDAKTVFLFSGQGSHYYQMGRKLFERPGTFRRKLLSMDAHANSLLGTSVLERLYGDKHRPSEPFDEIRFTHPAIFMVECALAQSLIDEGVEPDYLLGASLGNFAAAVIAGCIGVEEALAAVIHQAKVMEEHCPPGGMIAVFGNPVLYQNEELLKKCELAALNYSSHFVVAAPREHLSGITAHLQKVGVMHQKLAVTRAFHSRWIEPAKTPFLAFTRTLALKPARIPLACCVGGDFQAELSPDDLWTIVRNPIRFSDATGRMESMGAHKYIDVGPAASLATLLKYMLPSSARARIFSTLNPFGNDLNAIDSIKRAQTRVAAAS